MVEFCTAGGSGPTRLTPFGSFALISLIDGLLITKDDDGSVLFVEFEDPDASPEVAALAALVQSPIDLVSSEDVDEFAARVAAVDGPAVRAAIERSFPQSRDLAIVLIGDAARIRDAASKLGPVTEMKIADPRFAPL